MKAHILVSTIATILLAVAAAPRAAAQTTYVWQPLTGGDASGSWNTGANWLPAGPAVGTAADNNTADFNTQDITADSTVTLDAAQSIGNVIFGDTTVGSAAGWIIDQGAGSGGLTLVSNAAARTITVNALGTGENATINADLLGTQGFTKAGAGTLVLNGTKSITGGVTISTGTLNLTGGSNVLAVGNNLAMTSTTGTTTLDLGGNSQTFAAFTAPNVPQATRTATITNGSLTFTGDATALTFTNSFEAVADGTMITNVDLRGLSSFTFNQAAKNFLVFGGYPGNDNDRRSTVDVSLAGPSGTNAITALSVGLGANGSPQSGVGSGNTSRLHLGQANTINTDTLNIGTTRNNSTLDFQSSGLSAPTVTLRGAAGVSSRVATVRIASQGGGTTTLNGILDFSLGSVDARIGALTLTEYTQSGSGSGSATTNGTLRIAAGTFDATTILMSNQAVATVGSTGGILNSTITQTGGTVIVGTLTMGRTLGGPVATLPTLFPTYALSSGTLSAQTITAGTGASDTTSVRKIDWTGGTIQNFNDGVNPTLDLTISGVGAAAHEVVSINLLTTGANSHTFLADTGRSITVQDTAPLKGGGGITKTGAGTLLLNGATHTYAGGTIVSAGEVAASSTGKLGTGNVTVQNAFGAKLTLQTGVLDAIANTATLSLAGGGVAATADAGFADLAAGVDETVASLILGGTTMGAGTYGSTTSGAGFQDNEYFTGSGIITVVPEPGSALLALCGGAGLLLRRRR